MDEQLDFAPCGYVSLNDDSKILDINKTLLGLLDYQLQELQGQHINLILTHASQTFYQLYFFPMIRLQEKVDAMYITLKAKSGQEIPILLNASRNERGGKFFNDCACFPMKERYEYEQALLTAKKETDQRNHMKKKQIEELDMLRNELECKQNELLELNEKLRKLAETDGLTGLKNRRCLQESLTSNFNSHAGQMQPISLLLMDIDHFKEINDTYGHMTGDRVLQKMGRLLVEESRKEDIAARYGGEEFALILPNTDKSDALKIAERIRLHVEKANWGKSAITISIGAATFLQGDTESSLQSKADYALYASKNGGRNQISHFSDLT